MFSQELGLLFFCDGHVHFLDCDKYNEDPQETLFGRIQSAEKSLFAYQERNYSTRDKQ